MWKKLFKKIRKTSLLGKSERELDILAREAIEEEKGEWNDTKKLWTEWYKHKPQTPHFYYQTGLLLKKLIHNKLTGQDLPFEKMVIISLAEQNASTAKAMNFPMLCHIIFSWLAYDRKNYNILEEYLSKMFALCKIDFFSGLSIAVTGLAFDFIPENKRADLIKKFFNEITAHEQWYIMLWGRTWEIDKKLSKNAVILNKILGDNVENIFSKNIEHLYHFTLITSCINHNFFTKLLKELPSRLASEKDGTPYKKDLEYISGIKDLSAEFKQETSIFKEYKPSVNTFNIVTSIDRPLNIAVCISGQLRGYKEAFPSWNEGLNMGNNKITHFVSVWNDIGRKFPNPPSDARSIQGNLLIAWRSAWLKLGEDEIRKRYPNFLELFIGKSSHVTKKDMSDMYDTKHIILEDDHIAPFNSYNNAQKMYYKTFNCHKMARESNKQFDLILRMRPDRGVSALDPKLDWNKVYFDSVNNHSLYCENGRYLHPDPRYIIGDQLAIAIPEVMDKYALTFHITEYAKTLNLTGFPKNYVAHINFAFATLYQQVIIRRLEGVYMTDLFDAELLDPMILLKALRKDITVIRDKIDEELLTASHQDCKIL